MFNPRRQFSFIEYYALVSVITGRVMLNLCSTYNGIQESDIAENRDILGLGDVEWNDAADSAEAGSRELSVKKLV